MPLIPGQQMPLGRAGLSQMPPEVLQALGRAHGAPPELTDPQAAAPDQGPPGGARKTGPEEILHAMLAGADAFMQAEPDPALKAKMAQCATAFHTILAQISKGSGMSSPEAMAVARHTGGPPGGGGSGAAY